MITFSHTYSHILSDTLSNYNEKHKCIQISWFEMGLEPLFCILTSYMETC